MQALAVVNFVVNVAISISAITFLISGTRALWQLGTLLKQSVEEEG